MHIHDPSIKKSHAAKRIKTIKRPGEVIIKPGRWVEWLVQLGLILILSPLVFLVFDPSAKLDLLSQTIMVCLFMLPIVIMVLGVWARGWRLTLDTDLAVCEYRRTYLGWTLHQIRTDLTHGGIGPYPVTIQWEERQQARGMTLLYVVLFFLGPIGIVVGAISYFAAKKVIVANHYPSVVYYHEASDTLRPLLLLENPKAQKKVLSALSEYAPESVSLQ